MLASGIMNTFGKNGLIGLGIGVTAGAGVVGYLIYRKVGRQNTNVPLNNPTTPDISTSDVMDGPLATVLEVPVSPSKVAVLGSALQGLSPEQQVELKRRLDEVLISVASLRSEVSELRNGLQDIAQKIIEDVKKGVEESQRARRRHRVARNRSDSMSSSSIYFSASAGPASLYGGDSEAGYSTANAESDYTDRETDRETDKEGDKEDKESEEDEEDDEDRSCATTLTLRHEDSQAEEEDGECDDDMDREWPTMASVMAAVSDKVSSAELKLLLTQSDLLHEGDGKAKREGFQLLWTNKLQYSDSPEFLWRLARAYNDMYEVTEDKDQQKAYAEQGRDEAEAALKRNGLNAECHKWFAFLTGLTSQYETMHGKLKSSHILKAHLDRAISLRDDDPLCFYLLGRWCYEVAMLGWLEKKAAAALFETPPTSTIYEALENFLRAEELSPGFSKTVRVYIAKCHKELGNTSEASNWARLAIQMPSVTSEEISNSALLDEELQALINKASDLSPSNGDY